MVSKAAIEQDVTRVVRENVHNRLNLLQGAIGLYTQFNSNQVYRQILSSIISEPDFIKLLIVDKQGYVLSSNAAADAGKLWVDVISPLDQGKLEQALLRQGTEIVVGKRDGNLEGYSALCRSSGGLRDKDCGFILYRVSLKYHFDQTLSNLYFELLFNAAGILLFGIFLIVFIHFNVTRRARLLIEGMRKFASGSRSYRLSVSGGDELASVGENINALFDRVNSDHDKIRRNEKQLESIFNSVVEAIITIDDRGIIQNCNQGVTTLLGYQKHELIGKNIKIIMPEQHARRHDGYMEKYIETGVAHIIGKVRDLEALHKNGSLIPIALTVAEARFDDTRLFTGVIRDISDRKNLEAALVKANELLFKSNLQLKDNARTDALTGVANRRQFDYILGEELKRASRQQLPISMILCDVDFFKLYNDTYGHQMGDECLVKIGTVLRQIFKRSGELPARYGGEEFAVILPGVNAEQARAQAEQLLQAVRALAIEHKASKLSLGVVTLSLGVVSLDADSATADPKAIIRMADEALYVAKGRGRNCVVVYGGEGPETDAGA